MFTGGQIKSTAVCCANGYYGPPAGAWFDDNGSPNILAFVSIVWSYLFSEDNCICVCCCKYCANGYYGPPAGAWFDDNGSPNILVSLWRVQLYLF